MAFSNEPIPLGIVIRKSLVSKIIDQINLRGKNSNPLKLDFCMGNIGSHLIIEGSWGEPKWKQIDEKTISLSSKVRNAKLSFQIFKSCEKDSPLEIDGSLSIDDGEFSGLLNISDLSLKLSIHADAMHIKPRLAQNDGLERLLDTSKDSIIAFIVEVASKQMTAWIRRKLRDLVFTQSAADLMKDVPLLQSGTLFETGAIKLELSDPNPAHKLIKFSAYPRKNDFSFSIENALEFYFNTAFLDVGRQIELGDGLNPLVDKNEQVTAAIHRNLATFGQDSTIPFTRPSLADSSGDLSLIIPESLINSTLSLFYREGLLRFRTTVALGKQTKGIIAKEEQDVAMVLTIKPDAAPSVSFSAEKLQLEVKDYVMDVGTYIEDRIIPQSQIASHITLSAHLEVDASKEKIKLVLNPEDLLLDLKDIKDRLSSGEIDVFKRIANGVWRDFLRHNSELDLLPLVFRPEGLNLSVKQTKLDGKNIILDLSLEEILKEEIP